MLQQSNQAINYMEELSLSELYYIQRSLEKEPYNHTINNLLKRINKTINERIDHIEKRRKQ